MTLVTTMFALTNQHHWDPLASVPGSKHRRLRNETDQKTESQRNTHEGCLRENQALQRGPSSRYGEQSIIETSLWSWFPVFCRSHTKEVAESLLEAAQLGSFAAPVQLSQSFVIVAELLRCTANPCVCKNV